MSGADLWRLGAKLAKAPWRVQSYLYLIERALLAVTSRSEGSQLFILGPPRTGTTLIYQYIAHRLNVAYFTNGVGRYPLAPCVVTYAQKRLWGSYVSDFNSTFGKVIGPLGPREAGGFWNQCFDAEAYQRADDIAPRKVDTLRRTIWRIQRIYGGTPFVNKNVKHLLRIHALKEIFPHSFFLVVERDLVDAALSLLRGRHELFGDSRQWWSVRPPDYDDLKDLPLPEQVTGQYLSLIEKMEKDLAELPADRVLRISYEHFCSNPEALIEQIRTRLGTIDYRNGAVDSFTVAKNVPDTDEELELVRKLEGGRRHTLP